MINARGLPGVAAYKGLMLDRIIYDDILGRCAMVMMPALTAEQFNHICCYQQWYIYMLYVHPHGAIGTTHNSNCAYFVLGQVAPPAHI